MNIEWDYNYYQPWSNNEWLVDKMLAMLDEDITMQWCIKCLRTLRDNGLSEWTGLFREISDYCYKSPKKEIISHAFKHLIHNIKSYNKDKI